MENRVVRGSRRIGLSWRDCYPLSNIADKEEFSVSVRYIFGVRICNEEAYIYTTQSRSLRLAPRTLKHIGKRHTLFIILTERLVPHCLWGAAVHLRSSSICIKVRNNSCPMEGNRCRGYARPQLRHHLLPCTLTSRLRIPCSPLSRCASAVWFDCAQYSFNKPSVMSNCFYFRHPAASRRTFHHHMHNLLFTKNSLFALQYTVAIRWTCVQRDSKWYSGKFRSCQA